MNAVEILEWVRLIGPLMLIVFLGYHIWDARRKLRKLQENVKRTHAVVMSSDYEAADEELP